MDDDKKQNEMFNDNIKDKEEIDNSSKKQNINKNIIASQNFFFNKVKKWNINKATWWKRKDIKRL